MKMINLTKHPVNIFLNGNDVISIPSTGEEVRVETIQVKKDTIDGIPIMQTLFNGNGFTSKLPGPEKGVLYIVSSLVAMSHPYRQDLVSPNSHPSQIIKDRRGNVLGCKSLQCFWKW